MLPPFRSLALTGLLLLLAAPLRADMIQIDFDLGATTISALGGAIVIPPEGSIGAASASIRVPGVVTGTVSSGPGSITGLTFSNVTVDGTVLGAATITGPATAAQLAPAPGTLASLGRFVMTGNMLLQATGTFQCVGNAILCDGFPVSFSGTQTVGGPVTLNFGSLGVSGAATVTGVLTLSLGGLVATFDLVGQEVSRSYVPEPPRVAGLAAAFVLLGGLLWLRRR
jgi:hypothetical protein